MALKDWKQEYSTIAPLTGEYSWKNIKTGDLLGIEKNSGAKDSKFNVYLVNVMSNREMELKSKISNAQALKFAKSYMRTH